MYNACTVRTRLPHCCIGLVDGNVDQLWLAASTRKWLAISTDYGCQRRPASKRAGGESRLIGRDYFIYTTALPATRRPTPAQTPSIPRNPFKLASLPRRAERALSKKADLVSGTPLHKGSKTYQSTKQTENENAKKNTHTKREIKKEKKKQAPLCLDIQRPFIY